MDGRIRNTEELNQEQWQIIQIPNLLGKTLDCYK